MSQIITLAHDPRIRLKIPNNSGLNTTEVSLPSVNESRGRESGAGVVAL